MRPPRFGGADARRPGGRLIIERNRAHRPACPRARAYRVDQGGPMTTYAPYDEIGKEAKTGEGNLCAAPARKESAFGVEYTKADSKRHGLPLVPEGVRTSRTKEGGQSVVRVQKRERYTR